MKIQVKTSVVNLARNFLDHAKQSAKDALQTNSKVIRN